MMTFEIVTGIEIAAPMQRVWSILTDFPAFPQWNPFVRSIEGRLERGARLRVSIQPPGGKPMTFTPTLVKVSPPRELSWLGRFVVPGLFDGEHYFHVAQTHPDRCHLVHGERFSGLLVPLLRRQLDRGTRAGFNAMNTALRDRAMGQGASHA